LRYWAGFTAIGGLIDLAMYNSEKAKLKAKLEDWGLRFIDVNWNNFGRKEAELAVHIRSISPSSAPPLPSRAFLCKRPRL
jgi:hypothetical protein